MTVYEMITERLIAALENGCAPWRKPWADPRIKPGDFGSVPANAISKAPYRGVNVFLTTATAAAFGYEHALWVTFKQAIAAKCPVRKGEKATPVIFWKWLEKRDATTGQDVRIPMLRYYSVFNIAQLSDGWEKLAPQGDATAEPDPGPGWSAEDAAEQLVARYCAGSGPRVRAVHQGRAYYQPSADAICMPERAQFATAAEWYGVLFHELGHSTGHADRLARPGITDPILFGSHAYSREELVAEMTSAFLCGATGQLTADVEANSAAYLANWIKALRGDAKLAVVAGAQAQKAADLIRGISYAKAHETDATDERAAA